MDQILWKPNPAHLEQTQLFDFKNKIEKKYNLTFDSYQSLWMWSIANTQVFWSDLWDYLQIIGDKSSPVLDNANDFINSKWFPNSKVNYAENMIMMAQKARNKLNPDFLIFKAEDKVEFTLSIEELIDLFSKTQRKLQELGIESGDTVAAMVPNHPCTIILMLAVTSLGAIWSSCSPDFGIQGVLDRFSQIEPKIFLYCDYYFYGEKKIECLDKAKEIMARLPSLKNSFYFEFAENPMSKNCQFQKWLGTLTKEDLFFYPTEFNHPLFILFSSGTTGVPKCIVHGHGGTLLQHLKEHRLHADLNNGDKFFYFTTCGWMMWNWLISGIASGASLLLYDGNPFHADGDTLFKFLEKNKCTHFGTSAKFIDTCRKMELNPRVNYNLSSVRYIFSTGSPLVSEGFDYVYKQISFTAQLGSISGGTDIISCFILSNPWSPIYRGEISAAGLGMDIDIWDENAKTIKKQKGELVCKSSFPSKPIKFWNDLKNDKFFKAYFSRFPNIWCHGDFVEQTEHSGFIIYGRSDSTLNPGGVRIGTAEIYRQVELIDDVLESVVVGQNWDNDVRIVLFVKLKESLTLSSQLIDKIKKSIRSNTTPRHVPAVILQVSQIPRTKSGKIVELAVRQCIHGETVKNIESLSNPECLDEYRNRIELR